MTEPTAVLAHHLGKVSLDGGNQVMPVKPKFTRKYCLGDLEIQQTIGEPKACLFPGQVIPSGAICVPSRDSTSLRGHCFP